ncbi:hypothetical protein PRZ48_001974 [Zasmidium cellare]|uniref:Uncharacterized protein n=1 Tax=Zasmidium cellare TaxID=395010 RepID=A0ABR0F4J7_ZASCE|nr:hypothetical protein PRZ48_001974 [Zasmidium cellare]
MLLGLHCLDAVGSDHYSPAAPTPPSFLPQDDTYGFTLGPEASPATLASVPRSQQSNLETPPDHQSGHKRTKQHQQFIIRGRQTSFLPQAFEIRVTQDAFHSVVTGCACFSRDDSRAECPGGAREKSSHAYYHVRTGDEDDRRLRLRAAAETAIAEDSCIVSDQCTRWSVTTQQRAAPTKRAPGTIFVHSGHGRQDKNWEMVSNYDGSQSPIEAAMGGRPKEGTKRKSIVNVRERIKAIEERGTAPIKPGLPLRSTKSQVITRQTDGPDPDEESPTNDQGSGSRHVVPLVFPLHVRKFHRRRSNGSPLRPETPLYRSDPGQDTDIQSPLPQRTIPIVRAPSEASMASQGVPPLALTPSLSPMPAHLQCAGTGQPASQQMTKAAVEHLLSPNPKHRKAGHHHQPKALTNPFAHFHGTRTACVRHGRKSGLGKPKPRKHHATKDMLERSKSGAYIPVGYNALKQVEATSPWAFANSTTRCTELTCLTIEANKDDEDACPDCVAELGIKRREMEKAVSDWSDTAFPELKSLPSPTIAPKPQLLVPGEPFPAFSPSLLAVDDRATRQESWKSTTVEPGDSEREASLLSVSSASMHSARSATLDANGLEHTVAQNDKRSRAVRFNSYSQEIEYDADPGLLIVSRDLGEELDAVILERGGTVEKVITNNRDRNRTPEIIAKIARELAQIASTLSSGRFGNREPSDEDEPAGRTAVVDRNSDAGGSRTSRDSSIPELLSLINEAANDLQPGLIRKPTWERVPGGQHTWLDQTSANDFAAEFQASFTPFDQPETVEEAKEVPIISASDRIVARQRLDHDYRILQDHALANTQHDHDLSFLKTHCRSLQSSTPLTTSTCYASRPSSSPTQELGSPEIPIRVEAGEAVLPSHVLRSRDFLDVPSGRISPRPLGSPLLPKGSPCIFTTSTAPSLTASVANSAQPSPLEEVSCPAGKEEMRSPGEKEEMRSPAEKERFWGSPSEVKANSQAIRHVMRMERMSAVQEAAALERMVRRQRMVEGEARRALEK